MGKKNETEVKVDIHMPPQEVEKSVQLMSIEEFIATTGIRAEVGAGFRAFSGDKFNTLENWEKLYKTYTNRVIN